MSEPTEAWITVSQAARRCGLPKWKMRRRLHRLNDLADGRLLKSTSATGKVRKWWVSAAVLEELLTAKRAERTGASLHAEVDELTASVDMMHERLSVLDMRTTAQTKRLASHGQKLQRHDGELASHRRAIEGLAKSAAGVEQALRAISGIDSTG